MLKKGLYFLNLAYMRIFSNFNTKFIDKVLADKHETFDESEVFTIHRSKFFLLFHVIFHLIGYISVLIVLCLILAYYNSPWYVFCIFVLFWLFIIWFRIFHKFLKYFCDFTVVTPGGITTYKQKGILHCTLKKIPAKRIKAIEVSRTSLLGNIF